MVQSVSLSSEDRKLMKELVRWVRFFCSDVSFSVDRNVYDPFLPNFGDFW